MVEDPRDARPAGDDVSIGEQNEDKTTLDELEDQPGDIAAGDEDRGGRPDDSMPISGADIDDGLIVDSSEDEITLDELDGDTAGYFEVSAVSGEAGAEPEPDDEPIYEVEAAPATAGNDSGRSSPPRENPASPISDADNIRRLQDVEVEVIATLGTTRMQIRDILGLHVGSVVELHKIVGEPVDVTLNGRLIARGEVVVVDEKFAVRVNELAGNGE